MATIFSKIIRNEIPAYKIYEDDEVCAFLDAFPQQKWHTLIVPKIEIDHFSQVPEPYFSKIFEIAKKIAPALQKATNCQRISARFEGFEIPHCHFHLIPANSASDADFKKVPMASADELKAMQHIILQHLS